MAGNNHEHIRYYFEQVQLLHALERLTNDHPEIARKMWAGDPSVAEDLKGLAEKLGNELQARSAPPAKSSRSAQPESRGSNKKRPSFDEGGDVTRRVRNLLNNK